MQKLAPVLAVLGLVATALLSPRSLIAQTPGTAAIIGVVRDSAGHVLAGAVVTVRDRQVSSNADGVFEMASVPTGQYPLYVRRLGYVSQTMQVRLFEGDTLNARLTLMRLVTLDSIEVVSGRSGIAEFEERRAAKGNGFFLTRAELAVQKNRRMSEVLSRVPGLRIAGSRRSGGNGELYVTSGHSTIPCYTSVFIDNVPVYTGQLLRFNVNTLDVGDLAGIEFYRSGDATPSKYNSGGQSCGVLVIWTSR